MDIPSKKIIIASLFGIIILSFSLWNTSRDNDGLSYQKEGENGQGLVLVGDFTIQDSDEDGLKDWEEILWKTDPQNPDSDGDGILDGQEIKLERNPLVIGPGDIQENAILFATQTNSEEDSTLTDLTAQRLLFEYLNAQKDGPLTADATNSLVDSFSYVADSELVDIYKNSDIKISSDNSVEALKLYGNEMGAVIKNGHKNINNLALLVFFEAVSNEDEEKIKELTKIIISYKNIAKSGLNVVTPNTVADLHLSFLNNFQNIGVALEKMQTFFKDPLLSSLGVDQYQKTSTLMLNDFNNLNNLFTKNNIYFAPNESGYLFKQTLDIMQE